MKKLEAETKRVHMIVPMSWVKRIDKWRRKQEDTPNFSEAVRRLSDMSITCQKDKVK